MKLIISAVFCLLLSASGNFAQTKPGTLQVTYIANEGFALQTQNHNILIDALFSHGYGFFSHPSSEVIQKIMNAATPFDGMELCFLTHYHKDHSDSKLIREYLTKHPSVKLVTTRPSLVFTDGEEFGFVKLKKQFVELTPKENGSISGNVENVRVKALGLKHLSYIQDGIDVEEYMFNVGYHITMDGIRILHAGDASLETLKNYVQKNGKWSDPVDIAFLYYEMLKNGQADLEYLRQTLKPKYLVLMHVPPTEYDQVKAKVNDLEKVFPNILLFKNELDQQTLKIN